MVADCEMLMTLENTPCEKKENLLMLRQGVYLRCICELKNQIFNQIFFR